MGYWLPKMAHPVTKNGFFQIPDTKIIKVPLTMLQLTRLDIMQNGDDFWFIDMAVAENSAFYRETVPPALRNPMEENWLPDINHLQNSNFMV